MLLGSFTTAAEGAERIWEWPNHLASFLCFCSTKGINRDQRPTKSKRHLDTMDMLNSAARELNRTIDECIVFVTKNLFAICATLMALYFIRNNVAKSGGGQVLGKGAIAREEDIRQVRLRQQELADRAAQLAKVEAKNKKHETQQSSKKPVADELLKKKKKKSSDPRPAGYNPLMPISGHTNGYRPARRTVNRGGG